MRTASVLGAVMLHLGISCAVAGAADIGVAAKKLLVIDKPSKGKAKVVFLAKDDGITKGAGTGQGSIEVSLKMGYEGTALASGSFLLPQGDLGWIKNTDKVAKFNNKDAPSGSTEAKVSVIKQGKLAKLVGKGLGDLDFDILGAGPPPGGVRTQYCVTNQGEENCFCTVFPDCDYKVIAGGTGRKLVCKDGVPDPSCTDPCLAASNRFVGSNLTVFDNCTGLEWVKQLDCGPAVVCTDDPTFCSLPLCIQKYGWSDTGSAPDGEAFTLYLPQLNGTVPALLPLPGGGLSPFGTSCYDGHCDWRLPEVDELDALVDCSFAGCIHPVFGPVTSDYWSATTAPNPNEAWLVNFALPATVPFQKGGVLALRAVR